MCRCWQRTPTIEELHDAAQGGNVEVTMRWSCHSPQAAESNLELPLILYTYIVSPLGTSKRHPLDPVSSSKRTAKKQLLGYFVQIGLHSC